MASALEKLLDIGPARDDFGSSDRMGLARTNRRVLVVDDNRQIHVDFRKVLSRHKQSEKLRELSAHVFPETEHAVVLPDFELDSAYQGQDGVQMAASALAEGHPYAVAFVDIRMPPGLDGVETTAKLWQVDPDIQVVICSAYSDYSWEDLTRCLGYTDRLITLKKPFEPIEVRQAAFALSEKWALLREKQSRLDNLERAVAERTRSLRQANEHLLREMQQRVRAEQQLQQKEKLEALGRLMAGIAHEINNPLAYAITNLDYLNELVHSATTSSRGLVAADIEAPLADARQGAKRVAEIVRDVSLFSSRSNNEEGQTANVREAVEGALRMTDNELKHRAHVELALAKDLPSVEITPTRLQQILVNLLVNAMQALAEDGPRDNVVRVASGVSAEGTVYLEVSDNGPGIPPEQVHHVFEPFYTTKELGKGMGLGLSICHALVSAAGGRIELESNVNGGTTARVFLRCGEAIVPVHPPEKRSKGPSTDGCQRKARVLVIDDEPAIGRALARLLRPHEVLLTDSAEQALELCADPTRRFDLILCDVMMPNQSGIQFYRRLEQVDARLLTRLVFITGGAFTEHARQFLAGLPNETLMKPLDRDAVRALVKRYIEHVPNGPST